MEKTYTTRQVLDLVTAYCAKTNQQLSGKAKLTRSDHIAIGVVSLALSEADKESQPK